TKFEKQFNELLRNYSREFFKEKVELLYRFFYYEQNNSQLIFVDFGDQSEPLSCKYIIFILSSKKRRFRKKINIGIEYYVVEKSVDSEYHLCSYEDIDSKKDFGKLESTERSYLRIKLDEISDSLN
ncbi:MAG: hypothetical protein ACR2PY_03460, partial [Salinispira sp.]